MHDPLNRAHELDARARNTLIRLRAALARDPRTADLPQLLHIDIGFVNHASPAEKLLLELKSYELADRLRIKDSELDGLMSYVPEETTSTPVGPPDLNYRFEPSPPPSGPRTLRQTVSGMLGRPASAEEIGEATHK